QERLWFLDQLVPGDAGYHIATASRVEGRLRLSLLGRCLSEIERRHEALRTVFEARQGVPVQVVLPACERPMPLVDPVGLGVVAREREARRLAAAEAERAFDLARDRMLRLTALRLGPEEHVLAATLHHIAGDGWSLGILVRELDVLHQAFGAGRPSPLPE